MSNPEHLIELGREAVRIAGSAEASGTLLVDTLALVLLENDMDDDDGIALTVDRIKRSIDTLRDAREFVRRGGGRA